MDVAVAKESCSKVQNGTAAQGLERKSIFGLLILLVATLLVCLIASPAGNFPVNDDRIYAECVKDLAEKGIFSIEVSNSFDFIPIVSAALAAKVFGFSYELLRFVTIAFHLLGIGGLYLALRQMKLKDMDSAILSSVYALNPFMINLSLSFMSDVPALAFQNWCLYAIISAYSKEKLRYFVAAIIFLSAAAATRQTCLVLLPVIIILAWQTLRKTSDKVLIISSVLIPFLTWLSLHSFMMEVQRSIASYSDYSNLMLNSVGVFSSLATSLEFIAKGACYFGLFFFPISLVLFPLALLKKTQARIGALIAALVLSAIPLAYMQIKGAFMPYSLNLFIPPILGSYTLIGGTPIWSYEHLKQFTYFCDFAAIAWIFVMSFGFLYKHSSSSVEDNAIYSRERTFMICIVLFLTAALIVQLKTSNFDRYYLLGLAPFLLCLVPSWRILNPKKLRLAALLLSCLAGAYALLAASDVMNFGRAQWQAIQTLERSGVPSDRIDGGAMHSIHRIKHPIFASTFRQAIGWPERVRGSKELCNYRWWPVIGEDYVIASCKLPKYKEIAAVKYWSSLAFKTRKILILKKDL
jgi:hypothetical protein